MLLSEGPDGATVPAEEEKLSAAQATLLSATDSGITAPSSSVDISSLVPGTYSVNANMVIFGSDNEVLSGVTVYMTSDNFPPTVPQTRLYCTMTVDAQRNVFVTIPLEGQVPEIFTLQSIESGSDVTVVSTTRNDTTYGKGDNTRSGRIDSVTVQLNNLSGSYSFGNCVEFNNIELAALKITMQDRHMPIHLYVDLANAELQHIASETDVTESLVDEATGVSVSVTTSSTSDLAYLLNGASLAVTPLEEGSDQYAKACSALLGELYYDMSAVSMYDVEITLTDGSKLVPDSSCRVVAHVPTGATTPELYAYDGQTMYSCQNPSVSDGAISGDVSCLGTLAVVDYDGSIKWKTNTWTDEATGVSAYSKFTVESVLPYDFARDSMVIRSADVDLGKAYHVAFTSTQSGSLGASNPQKGSSLSITLPASSESSVVYKVTKSEGTEAIEIVDASYASGGLTFVADEGESVRHSSFYTSLYNSYLDQSSGIYYVVSDSDKLIAEEAQSVSGLKYTGERQVGFILGKNTVLVRATAKLDANTTLAEDGCSAVDADTYTVVYKPQDGYSWDGKGDTSEHTKTWKISKASISAYSFVQISYTDSPTRVDIEQVKENLVLSGAVNGDDVKSVIDVSKTTYYTDKESSSYYFSKVGKSACLYKSNLKLTINDAYKNNYSASVTNAIAYLLVNMSEETEEAYTEIHNFTYTGTSEKILTKAITDPYTGNVVQTYLDGKETSYVKNAGVYSVTIKLVNLSTTVPHQNIWSDGSSDPKTATLTVAKASLTATVADRTIESYNPDDPTTLVVDVTGFVSYKNLGDSDTHTESPDIAEGEEGYVSGYVAPTASLPDDVEPGKTYVVTASGGEADNYEFAYVPGNVTVESVVAATPEAAEGLVYSGEEQVGVAEGRGYTLSGDYKATEAGEYTATAKLKEGYVWKDGTTDPKTVAWKISDATLAAGEYQVTANLYVPKELNTQFGLQAYLTNPANPFGYSEAGKESVSGFPTTPMTDNATLIVREDGTKVLKLSVRNPVFTLQEIAGGDVAKVVGYVRDSEVYKGADFAYKGRITELYLELDDNAVDGTVVYQMGECLEYPFVLSSTWNVSLRCEVDYGSLVKKSDTPGDSVTEKSASQRIELTKVDKPVGSELSYTSEEQQGVASGEGYTLSGTWKATEVGSYSATLTLDETHVWSDGTSKPVSVEWSIVDAESVAMYRLYNPNSGEHFYTANEAERDNLDEIGWNYEGIAWYAPTQSSKPVYRLYNSNVSPVTGSGEHHYTMSEAERDNLVSLGWQDEGTGWYSDENETVPLYRVYNPNEWNNNHHYTADKNESKWLISLGWQDEGIAWYGVAK